MRALVRVAVPLAVLSCVACGGKHLDLGQQAIGVEDVGVEGARQKRVGPGLDASVPERPPLAPVARGRIEAGGEIGLRQALATCRAVAATHEQCRGDGDTDHGAQHIRAVGTVAVSAA